MVEIPLKNHFTDGKERLRTVLERTKLEFCEESYGKNNIEYRIRVRDTRSLPIPLCASSRVPSFCAVLILWNVVLMMLKISKRSNVIPM